ncbi:Ger(x)C family spore germination protein [Cohnella fermenti]|uniref:Ger(X)C family spore germination protein n=1 Tax=Cohnella fermenti TaxID=2565925 RepID=A0A4S4BMN5_9BACL|nr:Ger(x)C family spore germination protein [Cohnella fermenti]THF75883.1 Ger(x)C family spore germination protein [Cohnella fermenti]
MSRCLPKTAESDSRGGLSPHFRRLGPALGRTVAALLLSPALLLSGCWDRTEVNDLAIVTAAAIDVADDGRVKLSTQIFIPGGEGSADLGGAPPSSGLQPNLVMSAVGSNLDDAASRLQEQLSRRFFWGQTDVFLFGEEMAKRGIEESLDYLTRHPQPRERSHMFVVAGDAASLIAWRPIVERNAAEVLREMSNMRTGFNVTLLGLYVQLSETAHTGLVPYIQLRKSESRESPRIIGAVSIKKLRMNGKFDLQETRGLMWLHDRIRSATLTAESPDGQGLLSMTVLKQKVKLKPIVKDGHWKMLVSLIGTGNLEENGSHIDVTKPAELARIEKQLAEVVKERVRSAVVSAQTMNSDVMGFADQFRRHYPKEWKKEKDNWDTIFPVLEVDIDAEIQIIKIGLTGRSNTLGEDK